MGRKKGWKVVKVRDREIKIWELRQQGLTHWQIATELDMSQSGVSSVLKRLDDRALANLQDEVFSAKVRQTAALDYLYQEAIKGWERSQEPNMIRTSVTRVKKTPDTSRDHDDLDDLDGPRVAPPGKQVTTVGEPDEYKVMTQNQAGDPRFIDQAIKVLAAQRLIWGLDAPQKVIQADPTGMQEYRGNPRSLTDAQLAAIITASGLVTTEDGDSQTSSGRSSGRALEETEGTDKSA